MTTDILPPAGADLAIERRQIHRVHWTEARDRWLETLNNRHTQRAYARAVTNLCEALDVEHVADIAPGDLTAYRNRLVQRTEAGAKNPLAPASVDQQITALRRFLLFCWVNRATTLGSELIRFCLSGLTSQVRRPYEVPSEAERAAIMQAARSRGPRAHAIMAVLFGSGVRVKTVSAKPSAKRQHRHFDAAISSEQDSSPRNISVVEDA